MKLSDNQFYDFLIQKITAPGNLRNNQKISENFSGKHITNMNTKTVRELRSIAMDKGLHGYYKLKKADLLASLLEQLSEEMPSPPQRSKGKERKPVLLVKTIPSSQEIDEVEKEEMTKSRPMVETRLSKLHKWLDNYVPKPIKKAIDKTIIRLKKYHTKVV